MLPNLIHPLPIVIEPLDRTRMVLDPDTREPIHGPRGSARVTVVGQVRWGVGKGYNQQPQGNAPGTMGALTFRRADLAAAGVQLKVGDHVVSIGNAAVSVYLTNETPMATWPDQGGPTLTKWEFSDRQPARG